MCLKLTPLWPRTRSLGSCNCGRIMHCSIPSAGLHARHECVDNHTSTPFGDMTCMTALPPPPPPLLTNVRMLGSCRQGCLQQLLLQDCGWPTSAAPQPNRPCVPLGGHDEGSSYTCSPPHRAPTRLRRRTQPLANRRRPLSTGRQNRLGASLSQNRAARREGRWERGGRRVGGGTGVPSAADQILEGDGGDLAHRQLHRPLHRHPQKAGHLSRRLRMLRGAHGNRLTPPPACTRTTTDSASAPLGLSAGPSASQTAGRSAGRGRGAAAGRSWCRGSARSGQPACGPAAGGWQRLDKLISQHPLAEARVGEQLDQLVRELACGRQAATAANAPAGVPSSDLFFSCIRTQAGFDANSKESTQRSTDMANLRRNCGTSGDEPSMSGQVAAGMAPSCRRCRGALNSNGMTFSTTRLMRELRDAIWMFDACLRCSDRGGSWLAQKPDVLIAFGPKWVWEGCRDRISARSLDPSAGSTGTRVASSNTSSRSGLSRQQPAFNFLSRLRSLLGGCGRCLPWSARWRHPALWVVHERVETVN